MEKSSSEQIYLCKIYTIMSKQIFVVESKGYFIDLLLWFSSQEVIKGNWKGCKRPTNSSWLWETPGHYGKLRRKVKFLPKWFKQKSQGTYMSHIPLQQLEAHPLHGHQLFLQPRALWEVQFSCPQPGKEDAKAAEHRSWRLSRGKKTLEKGMSVWKKTHRSGEVNQSLGRMENPDTWAFTPTAEQAGPALGPGQCLFPLLNCLLINLHQIVHICLTYPYILIGGGGDVFPLL